MIDRIDNFPGGQLEIMACDTRQRYTWNVNTPPPHQRTRQESSSGRRVVLSAQTKHRQQRYPVRFGPTVTERCGMGKKADIQLAVKRAANYQHKDVNHSHILRRQYNTCRPTVRTPHTDVHNDNLRIGDERVHLLDAVGRGGGILKRDGMNESFDVTMAAHERHANSPPRHISILICYTSWTNKQKCTSVCQI